MLPPARSLAWVGGEKDHWREQTLARAPHLRLALSSCESLRGQTALKCALSARSF